MSGKRKEVQEYTSLDHISQNAGLKYKYFRFQYTSYTSISSSGFGL